MDYYGLLGNYYGITRELLWNYYGITMELLGITRDYYGLLWITRELLWNY